jgi:hypothetical protein
MERRDATFVGTKGFHGYLETLPLRVA